MAQDSTKHNSTHSTTAQGTGWSTRRIATTALLCALAAICTLFVEFPILPAVPWLKYDPSGIVCLIAGLVFGPATGAVVSIVSYLPHVATASGIWGMIMAIIASVALVVPAALIYQRNETKAGLAVALVAGAVVCVAACIGANIVITPFYAHMSTADVVALVVPALLPFNLLKAGINCVVTALILKPVRKALGR